MKSSIINKLACGLLLTAALSGNLAKATPIVGSISFLGNAVTNSGDLGGATGFSSFSGDFVNQTGGDYSVVPFLTSVVFTPFNFSSVAVTPLWTFSVAGVTYSFDATGPITVGQSPLFLNVSGSGTAYITGYAPTVGTWTISETATGSAFSFGATSGEVATPDGGSTALLISLGFVGIGLGVLAQRRNLAKA